MSQDDIKFLHVIIWKQSLHTKAFILAAETAEQKTQPPHEKHKIRITKSTIQKQGSDRMKTARIFFFIILSISLWLHIIERSPAVFFLLFVLFFTRMNSCYIQISESLCLFSSYCVDSSMPKYNTFGKLQSSKRWC